MGVLDGWICVCRILLFPTTSSSSSSFLNSLQFIVSLPVQSFTPSLLWCLCFSLLPTHFHCLVPCAASLGCLLHSFIPVPRLQDTSAFLVLGCSLGFGSLPHSSTTHTRAHTPSLSLVCPSPRAIIITIRLCELASSLSPSL